MLEGRQNIQSIQVHQVADVPGKFVQLPELIERRVEVEVDSGQQEGVLQLADGIQASHDLFFQHFLLVSLVAPAKAHAEQHKKH